MTCLYCSTHRWTTPSETVWTDANNHEYCVFHAPKEHKGVGEDKFNELIFEKIEAEATTKNSWCFLSGTIFPWSIDFSDSALGKNKPILDFRQAVFETNVNFIDFTAPQRFHLSHSICNGLIIFENVAFEAPADFEFLKCVDKLKFRNCNFMGNFNFSNSRLTDEANFEQVEFKQDTYFTNTIFEGGLAVRSSSFLEIANFEGATFDNMTTLNSVTFNKVANFHYTKFLGITTFSDCSFPLESNFSYALFAGDTLFTSCKTNNSKLTLEEIRVVSSLTFNRMDLQEANFLFSPLEKIKFNNITWKLSAGKERYESPTERNLTGNYEYGVINIDDEILRDTITFYRQMKKKAKDNCDDEEASLWHYSEKELRLHNLKNNKKSSFLRTILEIYRYTSRYGEDPWQALRFLVILLMLLLITLGLGGLYVLGATPCGISANHFAKGLRAFAQYALFMKPDWSPPAFFDFIAILLSRLLIPIQAAIFAFALRNKLHR